MRKFVSSLASGLVGCGGLLGIAAAARGSIALDAAHDFALGATVTSQVDTYQNQAQFDASHTVDGNVTEPAVGSGQGSGNFEWLVNNGQTDGSFTLNLGAPMPFTEIDLYNTHNGNYNDRGTTDFTIVGSNTIGSNGQPNGTVTTLLTGTLTHDTGTTLSPQVFTNLLSNGPFQYIQFSAPGVYGNGAGLNEIAATPEAMSASLAVVCSLGLLARRGRRR